MSMIWEGTEVTMAGKVGKAVITNYGGNTPIPILCSLALRVSTMPTVSSRVAYRILSWGGGGGGTGW